MKKMWLLLLVVMAAFALTACQKEYAVDGDFTAYEVSVHANAPMVTMVTVTIENGKVKAFYIDARQGDATDTDEDTVVDTFAWKAETKKELGDKYGMVQYGNATAEWYEQAESLEAYFLENGVDDVPTKNVDGETYFDGISGVTIKDGGYVALAQEALELAKAGKLQTIYCQDDDLYSATMTVSNGEFSDLELDVLQGKPDGATFAWNEKTKQELGDEYGMKGSAYATGYTYENGEWVSTGEAPTLEWFEQAALITDYVSANGWNGDLEALDSRGGTIDGTTLLDDVAGATIHTGNFYTLLGDLFDLVADDVEPAE